MQVPFVDLHAQYLSIQPQIDNAISRAIRETDFIGGATVSSFEKEFAAFVGVKHCIACGNGTDSLEMILQALGIGPGDEVIVPAHSWISTSEAVSFIGARPVFVDTHPEYYTLLPDLLQGALSPATRAIMPVHLCGLAAPMEAILSFAHQHQLFVIEDCAQAHGSHVNGKPVGSMGIAGSFSFYPGKNLGAYGDGGAVVTNDDALAEKIRMIGNHGQKGKHNHLIEGRNSRLDALQAAILRAKLPHLAGWNAQRRSAAARYRELLNGLPITLPLERPGHGHVYHLFVIQTDQRDALMAFLADRGVQTAVHYPKALPALPCYDGKYDLNLYPHALQYTQCIVSLPMYAEITPEQQQYVADCIKAFFKV